MIESMTRRPVLAVVVLGMALSGLWPASAHASSRGIITGTVTDMDGSPIEGAAIRYHSLDGDDGQARTDHHGAYRLRVAAPTHAPAAPGAGILVTEGQKVRFDFAVPRNRP
jgi:hypothetical protein